MQTIRTKTKEDNLFRKLYESNNMRLSRFSKLADEIMAKDDEYSRLTDRQLKNMTKRFKAYINQEKKSGDRHFQDILDDILIDAFAAAREGAWRSLGKKPYKVQIIGSLVLHQGDIGEMRTGEGKTLTCTMATYLNALYGEGVHVITVNEYLSQRDKEEMSVFYEWMGLTVGLNHSALNPYQKRAAYQCDITYSTNAELGFDYLRDNMVKTVEERVQRPLHYAVIDETDSVLIDEARTPLIISGEGSEVSALYDVSDDFVKRLKPATEKDKEDGDFWVDVKTKSVSLTDRGISKAEKYFGLKNMYDPRNADLIHSVGNALRANYTMELDTDYLIKNGEILIVDSFTGRAMEGRRFSDGLHQALEAKEKVEIQKENATVATITYQNFFRMYRKLSGLTGTGRGEAEEFKNVYNMLVTVIPTNKPIQRIDDTDLVFATNRAKYKAVVREVAKIHKTGQPILLGTVSIETSELLSNMLSRARIPHQVLNAKQDKSEADIVKLAGQRGAVTIATNMAGRGTDIKLGEGVHELGGLAVIGTERAESRRIDDQLRGRAGRQGDPGYSRFFLSLEDELLVRFGADQLKKYLGEDSDAPLTSKLVTTSVEAAQKRVEGSNYDSRKQVLQYDDVLRIQREMIYKDRNKILESEKITELIEDFIESSVSYNINYIFSSEAENLDVEDLISDINKKYPFKVFNSSDDLHNLDSDVVIESVIDKIRKNFHKMRVALGDEEMNSLEKRTLLESVDSCWTAHIDQMDQLRKGIFLRSYAQIDPLREYKLEGHAMFEDLKLEIADKTITELLRGGY